MKKSLCVCFLWLALPIFSQAAESPFTAERCDSLPGWKIIFRGKPLLVYVTQGKFKPYVKEFYTTAGDNVLRDSPFDHIHHHGLMYAIRVNGVNFWEENKLPGMEKEVESTAPEITPTKAVLRQTIHWLASPEDSAPLLIEKRTLTLSVKEEEKAALLHWQAEFRVGTKSSEVTLTGSNYNGLGMRFLQELDPIARHYNADGEPDLSKKNDVSRHKWAAVSFDMPNHPATIVFKGDASNTRADSWFFSMRKPFAYLSATQNLDKEPLVYRSDDKWRLNYFISLYAASKAPIDQ